MATDWDENISSFIQLANNHQVRMIMVGGGAVNFHGYETQNASLDFWVEATSENLNKIVLVLKEWGPKTMNLPIPKLNRKQNISAKFSPTSPNLELITNFVVDKSFSWAYDDSIETTLPEDSAIKWRVLALEDLIVSKSNSKKPEDLLVIQELIRINGE